MVSFALAAGITLLLGAVLMSDPAAALTLIGVGALTCFLGLWFLLRDRRNKLRQKDLVTSAAQIAEADPAPCIVTDAHTTVVYRNAAAQMLFGAEGQKTLLDAFSSFFADPAASLFQLQSRARADGNAVEEIMTQDGSARLSVHRAGEAGLLWRLTDSRQLSRTAQEEGALPALRLNSAGDIIHVNAAMKSRFPNPTYSPNRVFADMPLAHGRLNAIRTPSGHVPCVIALNDRDDGGQDVHIIEVSKSDSGPSDWAGIEALPVPLLKLDTTGLVLASNREARTLLRSEISSGMRFSDLVEGLGRPLQDWVEQAARGQGANQTEFLRASCDEAETFVQVALSPMVELGETVLIAVMKDVTELKTLEAQFVQSQKMQAIGQLAGGVAHDFNNLLTAISGHCDLLLLRHDQGDPDYGDLIQINQNANRAASLVGQLLAFSRKQNLRLEVLDIRDTMSDLTHLLNRLVGERIRLSLSHDPGLQPIRADKRQLEQVMMNLVVNARDAMANGGEIRIETESVTLATPLERDRAIVPVGNYVAVKVHDEGTGIAPEKLPKIFEPFYTTKRVGEGTGLGLSTVYGIVKQTGGFIFVDSPAGGGTTFTMLLPAYDKPAPKSNPAPELTLPPMGMATDGVVLLVEDEAPVRAFASRALRMRGYTVLEADCAETALEMLSDPELRVDVFVSDVIMPGLDGPSWVREALKTRPRTRVVFVSGYAEDAFSDANEAIPHSVFLPKPFSLNDLTVTVEQQLC
ncbi:ATP-binding protein [Aestuariibius insulae]|uniref:ATP-binding protein n=1 Tax=Aestuariibius insulae TaxID=2058287 RepID=UPI00398F47AF